MSDPEDKSHSDVPEWQKANTVPETTPEAQASSEMPELSTLEQAKIFLQDPGVQKEPVEHKAEFLKSKGISESEVEELLRDEVQQAQTPSEASAPAPTRQTPRDPNPPSSEITAPLASLSHAKEDRPPIVTYPEFLTKPVRPPPLVTVNGFLNTLYAFGGVSALIYGTSKYVLEPMVQSLTEARIDLHETANDGLAKLVQKLEETVSEIPPHIKKPEGLVHAETEEGDETTSSYDDPTELFHRDVGVQTSIPSSPVLPMASTAAGGEARQKEEKASVKQASKLTELVSSLKAVRNGLVSQTEELGDIKSELDVFRDELDTLSTASHMDFSSGYSMYGGGGNRNEPDDEIKKAKENIRRVKGVLLTTRSFPATTIVR